MLKCAIAGFGKIAETAHLPALLRPETRNRIQIVCAVEASEERAEALRAAVPDVRIYRTITEMAARESVDFVDICLPPNLHAGAVREAIDAKINIICEKPLARSLEESEELVSAIKNSGLHFKPCHQYAYSPVWTKFQEYLDVASDGAKVFLMFNIFRLHADNGFDPKNPGWRVDPSVSGGGILADTGYHYFYLLLRMLGAPKSVNCSVFNLHHTEYKGEDSAFVDFAMPRGTARMNLSWAGSQRHNSAVIVSPNGTVNYDGQAISFVRDGITETAPMPDMSDKANYIALYERLFLDFADTMDSGATDYSELDEAASAMRMLGLCYRSDAERRRIDFEAGA